MSLVAVLDADKEGFLRSESSLIQTMGRAARNAEGRVILYADKVTVQWNGRWRRPVAVVKSKSLIMNSMALRRKPL